jgi:large subunit ribosomal protein L35
MKQKLKTHKAMAKRIRVTAGGKFMRRKIAINHQLATADTRRLKRLLPYAF